MTMIRNLLAAAFTFLAVACAATPPAEAQSRGGAQWEGVGRIVVIGDLHGDYEKYLDMLRTAELIDADGNWSGGATHLVQLGDVPDRGAQSRAIMQHLRRLEPQARRAGGYVHALIGNHEAMNVEGDLRYVHPGEYQVFVDRRSQRLQDAYYQRYVAALRDNPPESGLPVIDDTFRAQWNTEHPLGFVEHRQAWAPDGELGRWVISHDAVIRINDMLFMHAGLGPAFANVERETMNDAIRAALRGRPSEAYPDIVTNEQGPLWYRGLANNAEEAERANLEAVLAYHGVSRVILGHTKRASTVLPRFDGRVILTDIAVPSGFEDPHAFLIIENGELTTIYRGNRVPLRASSTEELCSYFEAIAALDPAESPNARAATRCRAPAETPPEPSPDNGQ